MMEYLQRGYNLFSIINSLLVLISMKTTINLDVKQSVMNNAVKESMPAVARADSSRAITA
jgi:hypothetical protein